MRLFEPSDLLTAADLLETADAALEPQKATVDSDLDSARLWISADDGLLVRGVKPHSADKAKMVARSIDTVTTAMAGQWFSSRYGVAYLELYAGPGRLLDEGSGTEQPGSPLSALGIRKPFSRYVFNDISTECTSALRERTRTAENVTVLDGDANDPLHLEVLLSQLDPRALVIAYVDPARPQDLQWETIRAIAERFRFVDLIINLPVNSLLRAIHGARASGHGPGAAGRFLNHPNPRELLSGSYQTDIAAIRAYYDAQLATLGFLKPARRTIIYPQPNPYYDILLASRHPTAVKLWNRSNPQPTNPQLSFLADPDHA